MRYFIITYGCQMNKSDSERIATLLESIGYKQASKESGADLIVVNMCSVRQSAVDRVYGLLPKFQKLKVKNPRLKTILTGCIVKKDRKKFAQGFDLILGIRNLSQWKEALQTYRPVCRSVEGENYLSIKPKHQNGLSAFVPISIGCNNFCSYCVVPYTRGPLVCRPHQDILKEIKELINKQGYEEIWLLGQNVNDYVSEEQTPKTALPTGQATNSEQKMNFPKLLRIVNNISGNFWIRFISPHPMDFSDELIETMAECEKVAPYLNLPVQSGDNEILKKMNRPYTVEQYKKLVQKIRKKIPDINLSTDVIVGFPGETKKQFENTVKLFKEIKFDMAFVAKYSPRPQTAAFQMKDDIPLKEKKAREKTLREILKNG